MITVDEAGIMSKWKRVPSRNLWLMCIIGGVLAGTMWANLLSGELLGQIGYFDGIYQTERAYSGREQWQLWRYIIRQRLCEIGMGSLIAMTPFAVAGYFIGAFGAGFVLAVLITLFTLEKGWLGVLYWLASVLPHGFCYLTAWMILAAAVVEKQDLKKVRIWLFIGILVAAGSFLEAWVNPQILNVLFA